MALIMALLTGCSAQNTQGNTPGAAKGSAENTDNTQPEGEPAAMGRYVEREIELPETLGRIHSLNKLSDGTLVILEENQGRCISPDNGETWSLESLPGITDWEAFKKANYIFDMKASPDGTIALLATPNIEEGEDFDPQLQLLSPDGTVCSIDVTVPKDEVYVYKVWFSDAGELFALTLHGGIYRVDMDKRALVKYLTMEKRPDILWLQGNILMAQDYTPEILLYDREQETYIEDEVLADFMQSNYGGDNYYASSSDYFALYFFPDEDVIYVAGEKGLYRHAMGGSAMEQVIDGSLSSFGNPAIGGMTGMLPLGEYEFITLFAGGKIVKFHYDDTVPTVPENMLTVYSLTEDDAIRQAIAAYQTQHPDMYVKYEIGMEQGDASTRDDAIKKLNTEIMAGKGPDVLVLDRLPIDSYVEKGLLLDLSSCVQDMTGEAALLPNIVDSFTKDGKLYMLPVTVKAPILVGGEEAEGVRDLASLADTVEQLRRDHPGKGIIGLFCEEAAVEWFFPMTAPAFRNEAGAIDRAAVGDYLTQIKRIYDASHEGISDRTQEMYEYRTGLYQENGKVGVRDFNEVLYDTEYGLGELVFMSGILNNFYNFQTAVSLKRIAGLENTKVVILAGKDGNAFVPSTMTGINAASPYTEQAEDFLRTLMSKEVQELLYEGFAVNQAALKVQMSPEWKSEGKIAAPGEICGSIGSSWGDGTSFSMEIYIPTEEETQELYDSFCALDTPYIADSVIEEAVVEAGAAFIRGEISLDEAVSEIEKNVAIYLSE